MAISIKGRHLKGHSQLIHQGFQIDDLFLVQPDLDGWLCHNWNISTFEHLSDGLDGWMVSFS